MTLAFDTATAVATSALLRDGTLLGERISTPVRLLVDVDDLLREAGASPEELTGLVVGVGPGSFTGIRIGLSAARSLAFALSLKVAGVSTLRALAQGAPGAVPIVDAKRGEIFTLLDGVPACLRPAELELEAGMSCVGDGAVRYRPVWERAGAVVPPDPSALHLPLARFHAVLADEFGPAEQVDPLYLRIPDADRIRG